MSTYSTYSIYVPVDAFPEPEQEPLVVPVDGAHEAVQQRAALRRAEVPDVHHRLPAGSVVDDRAAGASGCGQPLQRRPEPHLLLLVLVLVTAGTASTSTGPRDGGAVRCRRRSVRHFCSRRLHRTLLLVGARRQAGRAVHIIYSDRQGASLALVFPGGVSMWRNRPATLAMCDTTPLLSVVTLEFTDARVQNSAMMYPAWILRQAMRGAL